MNYSHDEEKFTIPFHKSWQCSDHISSDYFWTQYYQVILKKCNISDGRCQPFNKNISQISIFMTGKYQFNNIVDLNFKNHLEYELEYDYFKKSYSVLF